MNLKGRILIIDDNQAIHRDFRKILCPDQGSTSALPPLFEKPWPERVETFFELDCACQGHEGLELVRKARLEQRPYLLAFVDIRMPPGWDGIETTAKIWEIDPDLEVVICTAYSDYSWHQMASKLNRADKFLILKKPFDVVEVLQLVHAFAEKRQLQTQLAERTRKLEESELRYRTILETLPCPVFVVDSDVRILGFNLSASTLLEPQSGQVLRQRGGDALHCMHAKETKEGCGHAPDCVTCVLRDAVRNVMSGDRVMRRKASLLVDSVKGPKTLDMLVTAMPIELKGVRLALIILEDISELITLRGLLPVCARCKSIRKDEQYWQAIDSYLRANLHADFSHGMCPKCAQELHPEAFKQVVARKPETQEAPVKA